MTTLDPSPLRIIPPDGDEGPLRSRPGETRAKRFDYAALARRRAAHRPPSPPPPGEAAGATALAHDDGAAQEDASNDTPPFDAAAPHALAADASETDLAYEALLRRLPGATMPAVDALFRTQGHFLELARTLAREVAAFCADPAVGEAGNWEVRIPLDERMLPATTLYLSLSHFRLSLRFDTGGIETRQLLLDHSAMLERELDALLNAWGAPRDIELTVW